MGGGVQHHCGKHGTILMDFMKIPGLVMEDFLHLGIHPGLNIRAGIVLKNIGGQGPGLLINGMKPHRNVILQRGLPEIVVKHAPVIGAFKDVVNVVNRRLIVAIRSDVLRSPGERRQKSRLRRSHFVGKMVKPSERGRLYALDIAAEGS